MRIKLEGEPMRLHWTTWLAVVLMAGALVACQVYRYEATLGTDERGFELRVWAHGWPCWMWTQYNPWRVRPAAYNLVSSSIVIICTGLVAERWRRNHWQLRMASLFRLTAIVAVLLVWPTFPGWLRESTHFRPIPPFWLPWWLCLPLLIGLGCTLYAFGWAVYWLASQVARRLRNQAG